MMTSSHLRSPNSTYALSLSSRPRFLLPRDTEVSGEHPQLFDQVRKPTCLCPACSSRLSEPRREAVSPPRPRSCSDCAAHPVLWSRNVPPAILNASPVPGVAGGQHEPLRSLGAVRLERAGCAGSPFLPSRLSLALPGRRRLSETALRGTKLRQQFLVHRTVFHSFPTLLFPPLLLRPVPGFPGYSRSSLLTHPPLVCLSTLALLIVWLKAFFSARHKLLQSALCRRVSPACFPLSSISVPTCLVD